MAAREYVLTHGNFQHRMDGIVKLTSQMWDGGGGSANSPRPPPTAPRYVVKFTEKKIIAILPVLAGHSLSRWRPFQNMSSWNNRASRFAYCRIYMMSWRTVQRVYTILFRLEVLFDKVTRSYFLFLKTSTPNCGTKASSTVIVSTTTTRLLQIYQTCIEHATEQWRPPRPERLESTVSWRFVKQT